MYYLTDLQSDCCWTIPRFPSFLGPTSFHSFMRSVGLLLSLILSLSTSWTSLSQELFKIFLKDQRLILWTELYILSSLIKFLFKIFGSSIDLFSYWVLIVSYNFQLQVVCQKCMFYEYFCPVCLSFHSFNNAFHRQKVQFLYPFISWALTVVFKELFAS